MKFANLVEICLWPHLAVKGLLHNFKQAVSLENEPDDEVNVATKQRERATNVPFLQCTGNGNRQLYKRVKIYKTRARHRTLLWSGSYPVVSWVSCVTKQESEEYFVSLTLHQTHSNNLSFLLWTNYSNNTNSFRDGDNFCYQERNVFFLFNFVKQTKNTNVHIKSLSSVKSCPVFRPSSSYSNH